MKSRIYIDLETFSDIDLIKAGHYKYSDSPFFDIILICWAENDMPVKVDTEVSEELKLKLENSIVIAHNASFERVCLEKFDIEIKDFRCTSIMAGHCGFPKSLMAVSKILLKEAKLETGTALINHFCSYPIKPFDSDKWAQFVEYCIRDVEACRNLYKIFRKYPSIDWQDYRIDQNINDRGVLIDKELVQKAIAFDNVLTKDIKSKLKKLTGLDNPNSTEQFKSFVESFIEVENVQKQTLQDLLNEEIPERLKEAIQLKLQLSKSSVKKYKTMLECAGFDNRARGLFQFNGASKTGRWAGRLIQVHNLPRNNFKELDKARKVLKSGSLEAFASLTDNPKQLLSELIRTAFISSTGALTVADFSSIEARLIAWLAGEKWRLEVFETHGKIYEASASRMFNVPINSITKGSELRYKGKVSELSLGYQGGTGALIRMGALRMGIEEHELAGIVKRWRAANPAIVQLWTDLDKAVKEAVLNKGKEVFYKALSFMVYRDMLHIRLPSGRYLLYVRPHLGDNQFGQQSVCYWHENQTSKKWEVTNLYGGKIVENVIQAIARDCLMVALRRAENSGLPVVMHVHDEIITEGEKLEELLKVMETPIDWLEGFQLKAEGFISEYYKKD